MSWKNILVKPSCTIRDGINILEDYPYQILIVVDQSNNLLGCVTDGDIRRAIITNKTIEDSVATIMNANPVSLQVGASEDEALLTLRKHQLSHLPVLDNKQVVGLRTLRDFACFKPDIKSNCTVLIMAGGFGTRLSPVTDNLPKPMVKINGVPIIEHIINKLSIYGFIDIVISVHYLADCIMDYCGDGSQWGVNIRYIYEREPLGTAGALNQLHLGPHTDAIMLINGDVISNVHLEQMLQFHYQKNTTTITVASKVHQTHVAFGTIEHHNHKVTQITEKPVISHYISAGVYVIDPSLLHIIRDLKKIDMPQFVNMCIASGHQVIAFPIINYWKDVGTLPDLDAARKQNLKDLQNE